MSVFMDGKALAAKLRVQLKEKVLKIKEEGKEIGLAVVLVGDNPASQVYVRNKIKGCEEVGIRSYSYNLPTTATQKQVEELVLELLSEAGIEDS